MYLTAKYFHFRYTYAINDNIRIYAVVLDVRISQISTANIYTTKDIEDKQIFVNKLEIV